VGKVEGIALYRAGYDDAQSMCLTTGSTQAAREWVEANRHADPAYVSGFDWGLYDFEDANGLRHERRTAG